MTTDWLEKIRWNDEGLVPAIAQETGSGQVLMMGWMDRAALQETVRTGRAVYWSRARKRLWTKGESSGHTQIVHDIRVDCDYDAVLLQVEQHGGIACHTGRAHCFFYQLRDHQWVAVEPVLKDPRLIYRDK